MNDKTDVIETLKSARVYLNDLNNLHNKIKCAEQQVCNTSQQTEAIIASTFNQLLIKITKVLDTKKEELLVGVRAIKCQSLLPLEECRADISRKISNTNKLIEEGENILNGKCRNVNGFNEKSSSLGSLPEIPELKEVPYISFQFDSSTERSLLELCSQFGNICKIAPIQISQTTEKPGAILIEWQNVESEEQFVDIQEYRLQRAFGDVLQEEHLIANFSDCYTGQEMQYLVKDLQPSQPYSFRVCCKFEGSTEWSPWSLSQVTATTIKPFSWAEDKDHLLTNENKIATPVRNSPCLLVSHGPQMSGNYAIEFTYLEFDNKLSTVGLITDGRINKDDLKMSTQHFLLDSTGEIYVDGSKKSTKLPEAKKGMKVYFICELIHGGTIRVNIETCEKQVTYDWHMSEKNFYFTALLHSSGSKIMVE